MIEIDGPEVPILDGSALPWVRAIEEAGIFEQTCVAPMVELRRPVRVSYDDRHAPLIPLQTREETEQRPAAVQREVGPLRNRRKQSGRSPLSPRKCPAQQHDGSRPPARKRNC